MGCVSSKPFAAKKHGIGSPKERVLNKGLSRTESSSKEEGPQMINRSNPISSIIDSKKANGSIRLCEGRSEKFRVNPEDSLVNYVENNMIPRGRGVELVAAGWPAWLVAAAGEAITGWIPRRANTFQKLDKIGEGTYSSVFKAQDLRNGKTVALKRVRFDNQDSESIKFMAREIVILRRLNHPNIIKLEGIISSTTSNSLYLIFEYMEHDLTGLASLPGQKFTEPQVKCYMQQLLSGLENCHDNGVLHRDIKGSNLLINECGILKIADFGLATFFNPSKSFPLTSRVVTLWYRPPELLLGATHYGVSVDLWSAGCILGELYASRPILPGKTEVEQLHKIFKLCGSPPEDYWERLKLPHSTAFRPQKPYRRHVAERFQDVSAPALALIETLLSTDPAARGTATSALKSEFFTTEPFACDPSALPKYPPSKEIDARRREEETRRHQELEGRGDKVDQGKKVPQESVATLSAKVNADFISSLQKMKKQYQTKPKAELFSSDQKESVSGPIFTYSRNSQAAKETGTEIFDCLHQRGMYSGPLTHGAGWLNAETKLNDPPSLSRMPKLSTLSSLALKKTFVAEDGCGKLHNSQNRGAADAARRFPGSVYDLEGVTNPDWLGYSGSFMDSHQFDEKNSIRKPALHSYGPDDDRIYLSGPLLHPSKDLDQMLREHDRKIQEAARRARHDKFRHSKVLAR